MFPNISSANHIQRSAHGWDHKDAQKVKYGLGKWLTTERMATNYASSYHPGYKHWDDEVTIKTMKNKMVLKSYVMRVVLLIYF